MTCRVLIDAVGAVKMSGALIERMEECGVVVRRFRPPKPYAIRRVNNRTHRKILVVDGKVGLTGGVGIADEWTGDAHDPDHWRDTHVRVRGPGGARPARRVRRELAGGDRRGDRGRRRPAGARSRRRRGGDAGDPLDGGGGGHQRRDPLLPRDRGGPRAHRPDVGLLRAPARFLEALEDAAGAACACGCWSRARRSTRTWCATPAGRRYGGAARRRASAIWEYRPTMLHAKTLVVDGVWSAVGSANFDNRSFQLNDEAVLAVQDRPSPTR